MAKKARKTEAPDTKGKRVEFDIETWQALDVMAHERMMTFQELADEAFRDVLKKYGRPYDVRDALKKSAKAADDAKVPAKKRKAPKKQTAHRRGDRRARS